MFPTELTNMGVTVEDFYSPGIDADYARDRRIDYLECQAIELRAHIDALKIQYQQEFEEDGSYNDRYIIYYQRQEMARELKKIETELWYLQNKDDDREDLSLLIQRAKQRLFSDFIELKRGKALCPFHDDHNPSFSVRHNRGRCFACGWHGDLIDFIQEKYSLSFSDAVKRLN